MRHLLYAACAAALLLPMAATGQAIDPADAPFTGTVVHTAGGFQVRCHDAAMCDAARAKEAKATAKRIATQLEAVQSWAESLGFPPSTMKRDPNATGAPKIAFIRKPGACGKTALACATGRASGNGHSLIRKIISFPEDHLQQTANATTTLGHEYAHTLQQEKAQVDSIDWLKEASANVFGYEFAKTKHSGYNPYTGPNSEPRELDVAPYDTEGYGFAGYVRYLGEELKAEGGVGHLKPWYEQGFKVEPGDTGIDFLYQTRPYIPAAGGATVGLKDLPREARFDRLFPRYIADTANDPAQHLGDFPNFESDIVQEGTIEHAQTAGPFSAQALNLKSFDNLPQLKKGEIAVLEINVEDISNPDDLTLVFEDRVLDGFDLTLAFGPNQLAPNEAGFLRMINAPEEYSRAAEQSYTYVIDFRVVKFEIPECVEFGVPIVPAIIGDLGRPTSLSMRTMPGNGGMTAPNKATTLDVEVVLEPPLPRLTGRAPEFVSVGTIEVRESCEPQTSNADITSLYFDWSLNACEILWAWQQQVELMLVATGGSDHDGPAFQNVTVQQIMPPGTLQEPGLQMACAMTLGMLKRNGLLEPNAEVPGPPGMLDALERHAQRLRR